MDEKVNGAVSLSDEPCRQSPFEEGDTVLARNPKDSNSSRHAVILRVYAAKELCLVEYDDSTRRWLDWKNLQHLSEVSDADVSCTICGSGTSQEPDFIVICDHCSKGFHQSCHVPVIDDALLGPDIPWFCLACSPTSSKPNLNSIACVKSNPLSPISQKVHATKKDSPQRFPYRSESLHWSQGHLTNSENIYCYCALPGNTGSLVDIPKNHSEASLQILSSPDMQCVNCNYIHAVGEDEAVGATGWSVRMLQCIACRQWFHQYCLKSPGPSVNLLGCRFYAITCAGCSPSGELRHRYAFSWADVALLVVYNLTHPENNPNARGRRVWVDFWEDVLPFLEEHWSDFTWGPTSYTAEERQYSLLKAILERTDLYLSGRNFNKRMSLFRFHISHVPAPLPDTKRCHLVSPIPYARDELPSEEQLLRFSLESPGVGQRAKRLARSLPPQVSPQSLKCSSSDVVENGDEADDMPAKRLYGSLTNGGTSLTDTANSNVVSLSGKVVKLPQGCARKSAAGSPDIAAMKAKSKVKSNFQLTSNGVPLSSSPSARAMSHSACAKLNNVSVKIRPQSVGSRLVGGGGGKAAAGVQKERSMSHALSNSQLSLSVPRATSTVMKKSVSASSCSSLQDVFVASKAVEGLPDSAVKLLKIGNGVQPPRTPPPFKVRGVRTLENGERQYLLDWGDS